MIGPEFRVSAYDGDAPYIVTEDYGRTVVVESTARGYDYTAPLLGDRCEVSKANVEALVEADRRWKERVR